MEYSIQDILKDLVHIDDMASEVNEKRQYELAQIEEKYKGEIDKLDNQLDEEKMAMKKFIENATAEAQKEAKNIEENCQKAIKALENKFDQIKGQVLSQTVYKLFGMEMDKSWIP